MAATANAPPSALARWAPSLPTSLMSMLNPFAATAEDTAAQPGNKAPTDVDAPKPGRAIVAAVAVRNTHSPSRSNSSVMFAEPDTRGTSESGSREGSVDMSRKIKRNSRPKTRFSICHPPPTSTTRQRLHRRPRSLLQLHKLDRRTRPLPAFEVIPSANFSMRLTHKVAKTFKARHSLCPSDLVVLRAEKYTSEEEDEEQDLPDIIGLICKGRKDEDKCTGSKMKICMASGKEWEAYPTSTGGYEFFTTDEHGLAETLRWVPKKAKDGSKSPSKDDSKKFNFSTISSGTRRHPVIASLSKTGLDINDSYKLPDAHAVTPLSTPRQTSNILADVMEDEDGSGSPDICVTDEALREIITMTAIWVTFKEGWSPSFKYEDKEFAPSSLPSASPSKSAMSDFATPPGSPLLSAADKRSSIKSISTGIIRRTSLLSRGTAAELAGNRNSIISTEEEATSANRSASISRVGRARGDSTSTVLVHRAASNRRNKNQAAWRADLFAAENEVPEASREDTIIRDGPETPPAKASAPSANGTTTVHRRAASQNATEALSGWKDESRTQRRKSSAGVPDKTDDDDDSDDDDDHDDEDNADVEVESSTTSKARADEHVLADVAPPKLLETTVGASTSKKKGRAKRVLRKLLCRSGSDGI